MLTSGCGSRRMGNGRVVRGYVWKRGRWDLACLSFRFQVVVSRHGGAQAEARLQLEDVPFSTPRFQHFIITASIILVASPDNN
jgi:hypothetical protein